MCCMEPVHLKDGIPTTNFEDVLWIPRTRRKFTTRTVVQKKAVLILYVPFTAGSEKKTLSKASARRGYYLRPQSYIFVWRLH